MRLFFTVTLAASLLAACTDRAGDNTATTDAEVTPPQFGVKYKKDGVTHIDLEVVKWPIGPSGEEYPAAEGFNLAESDRRAVRLADSIVRYHGGWGAYAATRFLEWNFFGVRALKWDKHQQRVRIESERDQMTYLVNYGGENLSGRVQRGDTEITEPDSVAYFLDKAHSIFINDSYWLVHHYKLKDSGVTLKLVDDDAVDPQAKRLSFVLDMTFDGVGDTPGNRYRLYVDKVNFRINTWQFFRQAADEKPAIETPWKAYFPMGNIALSEDRGGRFQLAPVLVDELTDESVFSEF